VSWKTPAENRADTIKHGTYAKKVARKLTIDQVEAIRISGDSCFDLAKQYDVSISAIFKIKRGETWATPRSKLTLENIRRIKDASEDDAMAIGKSLGLDRYKVNAIRTGQRFAGVD
jgi:hypothetical protein